VLNFCYNFFSDCQLGSALDLEVHSRLANFSADGDFFFFAKKNTFFANNTFFFVKNPFLHKYTFLQTNLV
jgi:hypothetical protein